MTGWVGYWDMILILSAVIVSGLAIRTLDRRSRGYPSAEGPLDPSVGYPLLPGPEAAADPVLAEHSTRFPMSTL